MKDATGKYESARAALAVAREQVRLEEEKVKAARREEMEGRRAEERKKTAEFRAKLEEEHGMVGHPKADALWDKVWDRGHSDGYEAIEAWYMELVELVL